jgi:hypothetical protein
MYCHSSQPTKLLLAEHIAELQTRKVAYSSGSQSVVRVSLGVSGRPGGVRENNIGNGGKHQKKGVKIKTQKQSYELLVYKCESCH